MAVPHHTLRRAVAAALLFAIASTAASGCGSTQPVLVPPRLTRTEQELREQAQSFERSSPLPDRRLGPDPDYIFPGQR